jgi:hypothetical protein
MVVIPSLLSGQALSATKDLTQDIILMEEEKSFYGSTTKTTNITCPPGKAASAPGPDIAAAGCLPAVQEATAFTPRLP